MKPPLGDSLRVFVVWDTTTCGGLRTSLEALAWNSETSHDFDVPGLQSRSGEILRDVVLDGIGRADRVLVIVDRPNANVGFEAGLALGFEKPIGLVHFGKIRPDWISEPPFANTLVSQVASATQIEDVVCDSAIWLNMSIDSSNLTTSQNTLFLCPEAYEGDACRRVQSAIRPEWNRVPTHRFSFRDLTHICSSAGRMVWTIAEYGENADLRDGRENTSNAVLAGWFFARSLSASWAPGHPIPDETWARTRERFCVFRSAASRPVVDVELFERTFSDLAHYRQLIEGAFTDDVGRRTIDPPRSQPKSVESGETAIFIDRRPRDVSAREALRYVDDPHVGTVALLLVVPWSRPCREAAALLPDLLSELQPGTSIVVATVSVDDAIIKRLEIHQFPTLLIIRSGRILARIVGRLSTQELRSRLLDALRG